VLTLVLLVATIELLLVAIIACQICFFSISKRKKKKEERRKKEGRKKEGKKSKFP
jgi:preprotein translocase subunit YajC